MAVAQVVHPDPRQPGNLDFRLQSLPHPQVREREYAFSELHALAIDDGGELLFEKRWHLYYAP